MSGFMSRMLVRCGLGDQSQPDLPQRDTGFSDCFMRKLFSTNRTQDLLPYESYDLASGLFFNKSSTGFVIEFPPLVGCTAETEKELSGLFQYTLPVGCSIQFLLWADPEISPFLASWQNRRQKNTIFETLAHRRAAFLSHASVATSGVHASGLRNFRCIVSVSVKGLHTNPAQREALVALRQQVMTTFLTLGLNIHLWRPEELIQFVSAILCFKEASPTPALLPQWNPYDLIRSQVGNSSSTLQVEADSLLFDEGASRAKSYGVSRYPSMWSLGGMGELIGDNFRDLSRINVPFLIHYGVHIVDDSNAQTKLLAKAGYTEKQAYSIIGKHIPSLRREAEEYGAVRSQLEMGERLCKTSFCVTLFAPALELPAAEQTLFSLYRKSGWELRADRYTQLQTLLSACPMMWGEGIVQELTFFSRIKTTLSSECANLLPIQGEWRGTKTPGMLLSGRRGQMMTWLPFDNDAGNYNVCVVGRSGSGKSVFMQDLMATTLGLGGKVFVLDVGRSFEKSCHLMGGAFLEFTPKTNLSLNPFTALKDLDEDGVSDSLVMLKSVLSVMAAPTTGITDIEGALLSQGISEAWRLKRHEASISDIADYLGKETDVRAKDLSLKLFAYTEKGPYGKFFCGEANADFNSALNVIELEELKERKDLRSVVVQMVILNITNQMFLGDRQTPFTIVFDEAWDMLRGPQTGIFIETLARRLRKYNGSLVVGTQSINDFYASAGAQAAFDNSDWMCLLSQKKESIDQLKKTERFSMTPHMEALLSSVRTKQGEYAEVLISGPHGYSVGRLILDPFSRVMYSTKADEFAAVKALTQKGVSMLEAIDRVASASGTGAKPACADPSSSIHAIRNAL